MKKFTFLLAFGLSFLCHSVAWAQPHYANWYWLNEGTDTYEDWQLIDNGNAFVHRTPGKTNYNKVRIGREAFYFEATYQHVYINDLRLTLRAKDDVTIQSYGTFNIKTNGSFNFCLCDNPFLDDDHTGHMGYRSLQDGDQITIHSIRDYFHVWCKVNKSGSVYTFRLGHSVNDWTNITHSTSEYYRNYLTNDFIEENRKPNYFEVDEHGDGTYLLHPGWLCNTHTTYANYYDHHNYTTDKNWTGTNGTVIHMHDTYAGQYGGWQELELDHDGDYTVQAIVRGPAGGKVKLRLSSDGNSSESEQDVYGMDDNSPSTVNTFGRVDYWDMGTNAGWTKVETTIAVRANQKLKIELLSDAAFEVSDVTLLKDANKDDVSFWTTAGLNETTTSLLLLKNKSITHQQTYTDKEIEIHFPYYNKFSFFDRGTNKNGVVYAHPKTVIGMPAGMADDQDHAHACNVAVPFYDTSAIYSYGAENNVEDVTDITCKKLKLTDTDGSPWGNVHAFGLPEGKNFTAKEVTFDREYKNGQKSTCVFPFAMTASELTSFFGSDKIYEFSGIEETSANFNEVTSGSTANKPFLVYPSKDGSISLGEKTIVASSATTTEDGDGNKFIGVYRYTAFPAGYSQDTTKPLTYMFNAASATGYYGGISKNGADIKPFRAYMEVPRGATAAPAKFFVNFLFNDNTAIGDIFQEKTEQPTIYQLDGTRVTNTNGLRKGVYIVNGKKLILK